MNKASEWGQEDAVCFCQHPFGTNQLEEVKSMLHNFIAANIYLFFTVTFRLTHIFLLLYTDPGSMLPLASGVAAVIGFLLLIWQRFIAFLARTVRFLRGKKQA